MSQDAAEFKGPLAELVRAARLLERERCTRLVRVAAEVIRESLARERIAGHDLGVAFRVGVVGVLDVVLEEMERATQ